MKPGYSNPIGISPDAIDSSKWKSFAKSTMEETAQAIREHSELNQPIRASPSSNPYPPPTNFAWPEHYSGIIIHYLCNFVLKFSLFVCLFFCV